MPDRPEPLLLISDKDLSALRAHAEAAYPEECCGLVIGRRLSCAPPDTPRYRITRIIPAANRHPEPRRRFELDPAVQFAALRELREQERGRGDGEGEQLLGHYHSHPDAVAAPSETDRSLANDPDMLWLIIAVAAGRAGAVTAWQVVTGAGDEVHFRPVQLNSTEYVTASPKKA